jgi:hypothetical protein
VAQERLFGATTVSRSKGPIIGWIQVDERKGLDGALYFQCVALNYVRDPLPSLLSAVGIKFNAVSMYFGATGDGRKCHTIADAGIDR